MRSAVVVCTMLLLLTITASGQKQAVVVGGGVIGLTTGITLIQHGWSVNIYAAELTPNTTSNKAAAFWLPFLSETTGDFDRWAQDGYTAWREIARTTPSSGVRRVTLNYLFPKNMSLPAPWWSNFVDHFQVVNQSSISGFSAFELDTSLIQTHDVMPWLTNLYLQLGGVIHKENVTTLNELWSDAPVVINCCGLAARYFVDDALMHPVRGQIVMMNTPDGFDENDVYISELIPDQLTYIVPRDDGVLLGGTAQMDDWNTNSDPVDIDGILQRAGTMIPTLATATVNHTYAGLRPYRDNGVRLEIDPNSPPGTTLVHNYGHGGSGWTVSWGCANAVLALLDSNGVA